jgi:DNA excision repair protein ERCC-4
MNILIKQGREEPDPAEAAAVGMEISSEQQDPDMLEKWNTAIHDLVTKLPGVTTKNQHSLLIKGQSLDHLISLSKVTNTSQAMHV